MSKKSIIEEQALFFMTKPEANNTAEEIIKDLQPEATSNKTRHYTKPMPDAEAKSKRVNLVLRPSAYNKLNRYCNKNKLSINEFMHQVIEKLED